MESLGLLFRRASMIGSNGACSGAAFAGPPVGAHIALELTLSDQQVDGLTGNPELARAAEFGSLSSREHLGEMRISLFIAGTFSD